MSNLEKTKQVITTLPPTQSLEEIIRQSAKEIAKSLPRHLRPERIMQIALTCVRINPELAKCTPASFLGALFVSAQLGIEPVAGNAYILPFNNSRKKPDGSWHTIKEAQFILGYKGLANLFYRHEKAVQLNWGVVHAKDEFDYQYGTKSYLTHRPAKKERGEAIGFYVIAQLEGGQSFMYMTIEECIAHGKKHSKTFDKKTNLFYPSSPWLTNQEAMCLKTVLIQLAKLLPLSFELQQAISTDETTREYRQGIDNALDLPDNANWQEPLEDMPQIEKMQPSEEIKGEQGIVEADSRSETPPERTLEQIQADSELYGKIESELNEATNMTELKKVLNTRFAQISKMPQENQDELKNVFEDRKRVLSIK